MNASLSFPAISPRHELGAYEVVAPGQAEHFAARALSLTHEAGLEGFGVR